MPYADTALDDEERIAPPTIYTSMPPLGELEIHPFAMMLLEHNRDYSQKLLEHRAKSDAGETPGPIELAPHHFYASEVIEAVEPIFATLDRVTSTLTFLRGFPNARSYVRQGITRDKWMEYHYAYFVVAYSSFRDLSLLLINQVFRLGLAARSCSRDAILTNEWVKNTKVPAAVKAIDKLAGQHQEIRNLHVHRGKTPDLAAVLESEHFRHLRLISFVSQNDPSFASESRDLLTIGFRWTAEDLRRRMKTEIGSMTDALRQLFAALQEHYERKFKELGM